MWFYPQRKLEKEHSLLSRILFISLLAHMGLVISLFIIEKCQRGTRRISLSGGSGARVTFGSKKGNGGHSQVGVSALSMTGSKVVQPGSEMSAKPSLITQPVPPSTQDNVLPEVVRTQKQTSAATAKTAEEAPRSLKAQPKTLAKKAVKPVLKKEQVAKKEAPKPTIPLYSELKKEYSLLKREPKEYEKKKENLKQQEKPKEETKPEIKKEEVKVPEKVQPIEVKQEQKAVTVEQPVTNKEISAVQQNPSFQDTHVGTNGVYDSSEPVTVDLQDGEVVDRLVQDIRREIARHFRRPVGFDDHEPLTISFEIVHQKATHISPRGTEPVVLYTAIKEALLKATFSLTVSTKVEVVY